jgi:hypothetical protein
MDLLVLCSILLAAVGALHQQLIARLCLQVKNTCKGGKEIVIQAKVTPVDHRCVAIRSSAEY